MTSWDARMMELARHVATWSKDGRGVGCVIVGPSREIRSTGYNGLPRGVVDLPERITERPGKYLWTEHAERNAIYNAARVGTPLEGCTVYSTLYPCADCVRAVIQVGAVRLVVGGAMLTGGNWEEHNPVVARMIAEVGLEVTIV